VYRDQRERQKELASEKAIYIYIYICLYISIYISIIYVCICIYICVCVFNPTFSFFRWTAISASAKRNSPPKRRNASRTSSPTSDPRGRRVEGQKRLAGRPRRREISSTKNGVNIYVLIYIYVYIYIYIYREREIDIWIDE